MPSSSADKPWRRAAADGSVILEIHVQPGARRTEVAGVHGGAIKIQVAALPVEGKANAALIAYLARAFGVPQRAVSLLRGETGRRKLVRIDTPLLRPDLEWS